MYIRDGHRDLYKRFLERNGEEVVFIGNSELGDPPIWKVQCVVGPATDYHYNENTISRRIEIRFRAVDVRGLKSIGDQPELFPNYNVLTNAIKKIRVRNDIYLVNTEASLNTFNDLIILTALRGNA